MTEKKGMVLGSSADTALNILQQLIRIRTHQPEGDEADAVKYIVSHLCSPKISHRTISHGGNRATLLVRVKGRSNGRSLLFMGHLDTIGLESTRAWRHYPYSADFDGVRVYGRGANNKGGATAMIMAAMNLAERGDLQNDVLFAFTADNDEDGIGARSLVEGGFFERVGEIVFVQPTDCAIGVAQKGVAWLSINVYGQFSHAAFPKQRTDVIKILLEYNKRLASKLWQEQGHPFLGSTTCALTRIESRGNTRYMFPNMASGSIDIRFLPIFNEQKILAEVKGTMTELIEKYPGCDIDVNVDNLRVACTIDESAPNVLSIEKLYKTLRFKTKKIGIYYLCDVSIVVPGLGVPFSIIGPGQDVYHSNTDENIKLSDILKMSIFYEEYAVLKTKSVC